MGSGRSRLARAAGPARSRALTLTELGSHLTVVPEVVAEPGVPANAALVVAATLEVQLVGGFKQRVQLDRRRRGGRPLSAALALRAALVFATALSLGFAFTPPLARGSGLAFARTRAIAFLTFPFAFLAGLPAGLLCHGCWNPACWESGS